MNGNLHHIQHGWYLAIFLFCAAMVLFNAVHWLIFRLLRRKEAQGYTPGWGIQTYLGRPSRAIFLLTCILIVLPVIPRLPDDIEASIRHWTIMAIVGALGWFVIGLIYVIQAGILRRYDLNAANNIRARHVHTQFAVFRRLLIGFVLVITGGALLWTFNDPRIWHYGSGLLASAGIASLILASAAKSTASNLLAGIQIAFTEPIRIDEITGSYVVLKIWDLRRMIIPLSYFIENPIVNWTRSSAQILGTSFLYVDYSVPVEELREELNRIVKADPLWDGEVLGLQVTNLSERTMELRCLMSSADSPKSFDLRCNVREKMTSYLQQHYPDAFPTTRFSARPIEIADHSAPGDPGANATAR
jgi:small-conductance mechanosensitive channel